MELSGEERDLLLAALFELRITHAEDDEKGAQIEALVEEASILAIQEYLDRGGDPKKPKGTTIEAKHFEQALKRVRREAREPPTRYASAYS